MDKLEQGDKEARRRWTAVLRKRRSTGEPYIMFKGNVNNQNPEAYKKNNLKVYMTNICVTGDTLIDVQFLNGDMDKVQISEIGSLLKLTPSIKVLSKNLETKENEWNLITDWGMTDEFAEVYEIEDCVTGKIVKCTHNHKFLTHRGWIEAKDLVETDELVIN
jgi:ribonucleotide reductase alpha subunit